MKDGLRNLCYAVWTVLGLVLIAHYMEKPAEAQGAGTSIAGFTSQDGGYSSVVITAMGDVYYRDLFPGHSTQAEFRGNFWSGAGPTTVTPQTWSQIKGQYAPKVGGGH